MELEREQERSQELLQQLERLSREDPLTGLANRRCWDETLSVSSSAAAARTATWRSFSATWTGSRTVNDRFGHATGDRVLEGGRRAF